MTRFRQTTFTTTNTGPCRDRIAGGLGTLAPPSPPSFAPRRFDQGDIAQAVREVASELTSGGRPTVAVEVLATPRRLTNAVRHAQVSRASVWLAFRGNVVELTA